MLSILLTLLQIVHYIRVSERGHNFFFLEISFLSFGETVMKRKLSFSLLLCLLCIFYLPAWSEYGKDWVCATESAPWTPREAHSSVVFDGKIWVIGGQDTEDRTNDVWYSGSSAAIYVPDDYTTIQAAIDAATQGDEIIVSATTYREQIYFKGKDIIVRSTDPTDPNVVENTIIDASQYGIFGRPVSFSGSESEACVLSGFTLTGGKADLGGGIYGNGCRATIERNRIVNNLAYGNDDPFEIFDEYPGKGGGIYLCNGLIRNNVITGNQAIGVWPQMILPIPGEGGGLADCDGTIEHNWIVGNAAYTYPPDHVSPGSSVGGGMANCDALISNNIIAENTATEGGGLSGCSGAILSNTIVGNSFYLEGGQVADCQGDIRNCIIWQWDSSDKEQLIESATPAYCCIQNWTDGGEGNLSDNPRILDASGENFHLSPGSPCIDTGDNSAVSALATDFDGRVRIWDGNQGWKRGGRYGRVRIHFSEINRCARRYERRFGGGLYRSFLFLDELVCRGKRNELSM